MAPADIAKNLPRRGGASQNHQHIIELIEHARDSKGDNMGIVSRVSGLIRPLAFPIRCPKPPNLQRNQLKKTNRIVPDPLQGEGLGALISSNLIGHGQMRARYEGTLKHAVTSRFRVVAGQKRFSAVRGNQNEMMKNGIVSGGPWQDDTRRSESQQDRCCTKPKREARASRLDVNIYR